MQTRFLLTATEVPDQSTSIGFAGATFAQKPIQKGSAGNVTTSDSYDQQDLPLLRQSERSTFKRCPQRWGWGYLEGLTPAVSPKGALWFGTGMHLCMAEWYVRGVNRGRPLAETWEEYTKDTYQTISASSPTDQEVSEFKNAKALGFNMIEQYLDAYGTDPQWEIIAPEQRFEVYIPDPRNPKRAIAKNVGTFDLVLRDHSDGKVKMLDHKNVKAIQFLHLTLDDQAGSYIAFGTHSLRKQGLIGPKESIDGMLYNFLRKAEKDTRPKNPQGLATNIPKKEHYIAQLTAEAADDLSKQKIKRMSLAQLQDLAEKWDVTVYGEPSKNQPLPNLKRFWVPRTPKERNTQIKRVGAEVTVMNAFRDGKLPLVKNPTKDCTWDCHFFDLCELHEAGGDVEDFKRMAFRKQDPYADHREGAENSKSSAKANSERSHNG